jgi:hypothetical protein
MYKDDFAVFESVVTPLTAARTCWGTKSRDDGLSCDDVHMLIHCVKACKGKGVEGALTSYLNSKHNPDANQVGIEDPWIWTFFFG